MTDEPPDQLREKLYQEIVNIPDSHLREIYNVIHFFRLGLNQNSNQDKPAANPDVMRFAGAWEDMPDFEDLQDELTQRRRTTFKARRNGESGVD